MTFTRFATGALCLSLAACVAVDTSGGDSASSSSAPAAEQFVSADCKLSGCGGILCIGADDEDIVTTCEWKDSYACYATARCEKEATGECGWTMTQELSACLMDPPAEGSPGA